MIQGVFRGQPLAFLTTVSQQYFKLDILFKKLGPYLSYLFGRGIPVVEVLFIRVHPNLCSSYCILEEVGPRIRGLFREHMAYVRAGVNLQAAPTLPHLRLSINRSGSLRGKKGARDVSEAAVMSSISLFCQTVSINPLASTERFELAAALICR